METHPYSLISGTDLAMFYIILVSDEESGMSIRIDNTLLKELGLSKDVLHKIAVKNLLHEEPVITTLAQAIFGDEACDEDDEQLYVISSKTRYLTQGSVMITRTDVLDAVCQRLGSDRIYVIPSSVHECLATVYDSQKLEIIKDIVCRINTMEVEEKDLLSYKVYCYDCRTKQLSIAR